MTCDQPIHAAAALCRLLATIPTGNTASDVDVSTAHARTLYLLSRFADWCVHHDLYDNSVKVADDNHEATNAQSEISTGKSESFLSNWLTANIASLAGDAHKFMLTTITTLKTIYNSLFAKHHLPNVQQLLQLRTDAAYLATIQSPKNAIYRLWFRQLDAIGDLGQTPLFSDLIQSACELLLGIIESKRESSRKWSSRLLSGKWDVALGAALLAGTACSSYIAFIMLRAWIRSRRTDNTSRETHVTNRVVTTTPLTSTVEHHHTCCCCHKPDSNGNGWVTASDTPITTQAPAPTQTLPPESRVAAIDGLLQANEYRRATPDHPSNVGVPLPSQTSSVQDQYDYFDDTRPPAVGYTSPYQRYGPYNPSGYGGYGGYGDRRYNRYNRYGTDMNFGYGRSEPYGFNNRNNYRDGYDMTGYGGYRSMRPFNERYFDSRYGHGFSTYGSDPIFQSNENFDQYWAGHSRAPTESYL